MSVLGNDPSWVVAVLFAAFAPFIARRLSAYWTVEAKRRTARIVAHLGRNE